MNTEQCLVATDLELQAYLYTAGKLHPQSPFIITQPKRWHLFYCPMEGRRLSWPWWLVTCQNGLTICRPVTVLTGP